MPKRVAVPVLLIVAAAVATSLLGLWPIGQRLSPPVPTTSSNRVSNGGVPSRPGVPLRPGVPTPSRGQGEVRFRVAVTDVSGAGLSRTVTAQVGNTGASDAHNVWLKLEAFSEGSRMKLNGQDHLRESIGTLRSAASTQKQVTLSLSALDGLKIVKNGAKFVLTVSSDEYTEAFSSEFKP